MMPAQKSEAGVGDDRRSDPAVSAPPTVIICDEHPVFRASLRNLLDRTGFVVRDDASCADEAVAAAACGRPDLCVIDIECEGGARAVSDIRGVSPHTAVVVLTASRERDDFFAAVRAGAIGYLPKRIDGASLPDALQGVLAGNAAIPPTLVASLVREFRSRGRQRAVVDHNGRAELTPREWEVAHMLAERLTTKEIAERLGVSPVTVRRHVSSILAKLEVPDREAAAVILETAGRS